MMSPSPTRSCSITASLFSRQHEARDEWPAMIWQTWILFLDRGIEQLIGLNWSWLGLVFLTQYSFRLFAVSWVKAISNFESTAFLKNVFFVSFKDNNYYYLQNVIIIQDNY